MKLLVEPYDMPRTQECRRFTAGPSKKNFPSESLGTTHFGVEQKGNDLCGSQESFITHWETIGWRCPLATGDVDALTKERQTLWGNPGYPYVLKGVDVWRLDRGMGTHWIYTVSLKTLEIIWWAHLSENGQTLERCKWYQETMHFP